MLLKEKINELREKYIKTESFTSLSEVKDVIKLINQDNLSKILINLYKKKIIDRKDIIHFLNDNNLDCNNFFSWLYINQINDLQFEEKDLIKFNKEISENKSKFFLSTQKNINFILNNEKDFKEMNLELIILNKNLDFETTNLFLSKYGDKLSNGQKISFTINRKLNNYLIEKYRHIINFTFLETNLNLTEEIILGHIDKSKYKNILKANVDKDFIKNNIEDLNYNLIFDNLSGEKEYAYYINLMIEAKRETILKNKSSLLNERMLVNEVINNFKNLDKNLDFTFYKNILKENNTYDEYDDLEKLLYFNEKTSEKYYKILENVLFNNEDYKEGKYISIAFFNSIETMLSKSNVPLNILEKNIDLFCIPKEKEIKNSIGNYEVLIKHQSLSDKIIKYLIPKLKSVDEIKLLIKHQIKNKKDYALLLKTNSYCKSLKLDENIQKKEEFDNFLMENLFYLSSLKSSELENILIKHKNLSNVDFIISCIGKNQTKNQNINIDYGLSI